MKKLITLLLLTALCVGLLVYNFSLREPRPNSGTEPPTTTQPASTPHTPTGQVRILNTDPDLQEAWENLAQAYTSRTGVDVTILTGTEQAQPTLFTVRNAEELNAELCLDLSGTQSYAQLASWDLTLTADEKVCGIAAEIEGFGLICNSSLLGHVATQEEITGLASLQAVAQSITADPGLGFRAFACPDLQGSFVARLASLDADFRQFWDVYSANAVCQPEALSESGPSDGLTELLEGKAVFYLGSTGEYAEVATLGDHTLDIIPLYLGGQEEQRQGLCVTCSSYWCVRNDADALDIEATLAFLDYLVHPREDGTVPVDDLQILAPYRQAAYAANPLARRLRTDLAAGKEYVVCRPCQSAPAGLGDALAAYAAAPTDENWAAVMAILGES